jgi:hypothetical protein
MRIRILDLVNPGSGMEKIRSGINIPEPQHWNAGLDPVAKNTVSSQISTEKL